MPADSAASLTPRRLGRYAAMLPRIPSALFLAPSITLAVSLAMTLGACKRDANLAQSRTVSSTASQPSADPSTLISGAPTQTSSGDTATMGAAQDGSSVRYHVTLVADGKQHRLTVEVCPQGESPQQLKPPIDEATALIEDIRLGGKPLSLKQTAIPLAGATAGQCVHYRVALDKALTQRGMDAMQSGDDLLLSPDLWMWTPDPLPASASVQFKLPPGWTAALPWPQLGANHYRIPASAFIWRTQGALGTMPRHTFSTGGATITAYVLGDGWGSETNNVLQWVRGSANAVTALFGRFPTNHAQTLLVTTPAGRSTFGMAMHGGGMSTFVLLPKNLDTSDIDARWTVVHELLHFSLPPVINRDAWLHEGITTYLTTKARARAGIIDASFAWWELLDGFERGSSRGTGRTLREESAAMRQTHQFWRVYWSGAAMALSMDMALTEAGGSLEKTLLDLADSRVDHTHRWEGPEVLKLLDRACGSSVPSDASLPHLDKSDFPDTAAMATALGVRIAAKHRAAFNERAPKAKLRQQLMAPRPVPKKTP